MFVFLDMAGWFVVSQILNIKRGCLYCCMGKGKTENVKIWVKKLMTISG